MGLSSDYSYNQIPPLESGYSVDLFLFIALTAVGIWGAWSFRRTHPFAPFLVVSYFLMFGLTSNVFFPIGTIMAERLAYALSLCLCVLGGWGLSRLPGLWMWRVGILLVAVYGCATWSRLAVWQNAHTFYTAQVASAPNSARAHYALAHEVYQPEGQLTAAESQYRRAVAIMPNFPDAWNNLGVVKKDQGNSEEAVVCYQAALSWHSDHVAARVNLGQAYQNLGQNDRAMEAYRIALSADSIHAVALNNLAILYAQKGDMDVARSLFTRALRHHPTYAPARKNYELFLEQGTEP